MGTPYDYAKASSPRSWDEIPDAPVGSDQYTREFNPNTLPSILGQQAYQDILNRADSMGQGMVGGTGIAGEAPDILMQALSKYGPRALQGISGLLERLGSVGQRANVRPPMAEVPSTVEALPGWARSAGESIGNAGSQAWDAVRKAGAPAWDTVNDFIFRGHTPWQLQSEQGQRGAIDQVLPYVTKLYKQAVSEPGFPPYEKAVGSAKQKILEHPMLKNIWDTVERNPQLWEHLPRNPNVPWEQGVNQQMQLGFDNLVGRRAARTATEGLMAKSAPDIERTSNIVARGRNMQGFENQEGLGSEIGSGIQDVIEYLTSLYSKRPSWKQDRYWQQRQPQDIKRQWGEFRDNPGESLNFGGTGEVNPFEKRVIGNSARYLFPNIPPDRLERLSNTGMADYVLPYLNPTRSQLPGISAATYIGNEIPRLWGGDTLGKSIPEMSNKLMEMLRLLGQSVNDPAMLQPPGQTTRSGPPPAP